jgi:hypothetical protein
MFLKNPVPVILYMLVGFLMLVSACVPAATALPQTVMELATPTPEVFQPVDPSPTSSSSTLPLTCQITDLKVYISKEWGYCFAYPAEYELDQSQKSKGVIRLKGPALDENPDAIYVTLEVTPRLAPDGSVLTPMVDAYLSSFTNITMAMPITREPSMLGNEPAEKLDPIPGLLSSRVIMALHDNVLYQLRFHPSDIDYAKQSLDDLTQTVTGSFAFLDGATPPGSRKETISWPEFGKNISITYDSSLAPWVEAQTVPAVPMSDQVLFAESRPTYAQFRFAGYQGGRPYQLPLLPVENHIPQVMVFRTEDFPAS